MCVGHIVHRIDGSQRRSLTCRSEGSLAMFEFSFFGTCCRWATPSQKNVWFLLAPQFKVDSHVSFCRVHPDSTMVREHNLQHCLCCTRTPTHELTECTRLVELCRGIGQPVPWRQAQGHKAPTANGLSAMGTLGHGGQSKNRRGCLRVTEGSGSPLATHI